MIALPVLNFRINMIIQKYTGQGFLHGFIFFYFIQSHFFSPIHHTHPTPRWPQFRSSDSEDDMPSPRLLRLSKEFLKYWFTCQFKNELDHPQCVICGNVLANESLKPVKMEWHHESRHLDDAQKPMTFFLWKEAALHGQKTSYFAHQSLCSVIQSGPSCSKSTRATHNCWKPDPSCSNCDDHHNAWWKDRKCAQTNPPLQW